MAKLPLITSATESSGPTKVTAIPKTSGDPKVHYDTETGALVAEKIQAQVFTNISSGLTPASGGGEVNFLRADGTWAQPPGGGGGGSVDSVTGTSPITVTGTATDPIVGIDQTLISIANTQVSGLGSLATKSSVDLGPTSTDYTGILPAANQTAQGMGGDVSGTTTSATVAKIQGRTVSTATPATGQILTWSGTQWVPAGSASSGSGGGGVVYYFNKGTAVTGGNLPANTYQLGRTAEVAQSSVSLTNLATTSWTRVGGFVTSANDPAVTTIPAGLWDFNLWVDSTAASNNQAYLRLTLYAYNGSTNPEAGTPLAQTDNIYLYDANVIAQYIAAMLVAGGTTLPSTSTRLYLLIEARASTSNRNVTVYFGNSTPSHSHTTIPSVSGTGLVKVIDGSLQTPASLLVDADVAASAAIDRTKLAASVSGDKGKLLMNDASSGAIIATDKASIAQGGTNNASLSVVNGTVYYGDGFKLVGLTPGTDGQYLKTKGAGAAPEWGTVTVVNSYDLRGTFIGTPGANAVIDRFVAARAGTILSNSAHQFYCASLPTAGNPVTIQVSVKTNASGGAVTDLFQAVFSNTSQSANNNGLYAASITEQNNYTLAAGDLLTVSVVGTPQASFSTLVFTIFATA